MGDKDLRSIEFIGGVVDTDNSPYPRNKVRIARYTMVNIIPKNLYEQFHRTANVWFLIVSVFQLIPLDLTPTSNWGTITPLACLLLFTFIKDAYNEYQRYKQDKVLNHTRAKVWDEEGGIVDQCWEDVKVGHIIVLEREDICPADLLVLATGNKSGTINMDIQDVLGQSFLDQKKAVEETQRIIRTGDITTSAKNLQKLEGTISVEQPNTKHDSFESIIKLKGMWTPVKVGYQSLLLRRSIVKSDDWIFAMVVYTGKDTKLLQNMDTSRKKTSKVEEMVNQMVLGLLAALVILIIISSLCSIFLEEMPFDVPVLNTFILFCLLYNNIVPISLYVAMDLVRMIQVFFIQKDADMTRGDRNALALTGDVNEDLGQIEYVIVDKTNSITNNELILKSCYIDKRLYRNQVSKDTPGNEEDEEPIMSRSPMNFDALDVAEELMCEELTQTDSMSQAIVHFYRCVTICNALVPIVNENVEIDYVTVYPEEEIMLQHARKFGFNLMDKVPGKVKFAHNKQEVEYEVIGECRSNECASILVKTEEGKGVIYTKGHVDNIMPKLCNKDQVALREYSATQIMKGCSTMVYTYLELTDEEVEKFRTRFINATAALINIESKTTAVFNEYENDMIMTCVTEVEDSVAKETVATLSELKQAGIKVWLVSGDVERECLSAGYASGMVTEDMEIIKITGVQNAEQLKYRLMTDLQKYFAFENPPVNKAAADQPTPQTRLARQLSVVPSAEMKDLTNGQRNLRNLSKSSVEIPEVDLSSIKLRDPKETNIVVLIDGDSIEQGITENYSRQILMMALFCSKTVICCNMMPSQKALLVRLTQKCYSFKPRVLAVSGSNAGGSMLLESHVGVGISKRHGTPITTMGEFSVGKFSDLRHLILKHGRYNYLRVSKTVLLFLYKNFLLAMLFFSYIFYSDYSANPVFDAGLIIFYNILFTSLPVFVIGVFDQDLPAAEALKYPQLYIRGIYAMLFNWNKYGFYLLLAIFHMFLLNVYVIIPFNYNQVINSTGNTEDLVILGTVLFISLVLTVLGQTIIIAEAFNWIFILSQAICVFSLLIYLALVSFLYIDNTRHLGLIDLIFTSPTCLFSIFLPPLFIFGFSYFLKTLYTFIHPTYINEIRKNKAVSIDSNELYRVTEFATNLGEAYKNAPEFDVINSEDAFEMYRWVFKSEHTEAMYRKKWIGEHLGQFKWTLGVILVMTCLWTIFEPALSSDVNLEYILLRLLAIAVFAVIYFYIRTEHFLRRYVRNTLLIIGLIIVFKFIMEVGFNNAGSLATAFCPLLTYILFNVHWYWITGLNIVNILLYLISFSIFTAGEESDGSVAVVIIISYLVLIIGITIICSLIGFWSNLALRQEFKMLRTIETQMERSANALGCLLPGFVKDRVKSGARYIAEDQGEVTIVFIDIGDFDKFCATYEPAELCQFLDSLFQRWDHLCDTNGVAKIETVSKTYMACGGLADNEENMNPALLSMNHARRGLEFAIDVMRNLSQIQDKHGNPLRIKVGINSGPVTAGVIGYHKPQFSLVGDTVNTAARMCSTNKAYNNIQISENTFNMIPDLNHITYDPKQVEAKGKGLLNTWLVSENQSAQAASPVTKQHVISRIAEKKDTLLQQTTQKALKKTSEKKSGFWSTKLVKSSAALQKKLEREKKQAMLERADSKLVENINLFNFKDTENHAAQQFRLQKIDQSKKAMFVGTISAVIIYFILTIITIIAYVEISDRVPEPVLAAQMVILGMILIGMILTFKMYRSLHYPWIMVSILSLISFLCLFDLVFDSEVTLYFVTILIMYNVLLINLAGGAFVSHMMILSVVCLLLWLVIAAAFASGPFIVIGNLIFLIAVMFLNGFTFYNREYHQREICNLERIANKEIKDTENLVSNLLPPHVYRKMKDPENTEAITEDLKNCTLLYADVCGFTNWCSDKLPVDVVSGLSDLFEKFDRLCKNYNVYKVCTIGDCYVIMSYTEPEDGNERDEAHIGMECLSIVRVGLEMVTTIKQVNKDTNSSLNMRIGIHTGSVIAGITGTNIVRYDIYGPDQLLANKMESEGVEGRVNVSEVTRRILEKTVPDRYEYTFNRAVECIGIEGETLSYLVSE